jgi:chemotaxis signal transduction protein
VVAAAGVLGGSRRGAFAVALGWFAAVVVFAGGRPEGDVIIAGDNLGLAWLGLGASRRRVERPPCRTRRCGDGRSAAVGRTRSLQAWIPPADEPDVEQAAVVPAGAGDELVEPGVRRRRRAAPGRLALRHRHGCRRGGRSRVRHVTRVPGTPPWLTGVANWRGRILPVVDIRPLLGAPATPLPSSARLLVLAGDGCTVGLVAEAVPGVHRGSLEEAAPAPATLAADAATLVVGQVLDRYGPIAVLEPAAVLALRRRLDNRRRGSA